MRVHAFSASTERGDAIRASGVAVVSLDDASYRAAYAVAEDNLRLGHTVVADSVNPLAITRLAWVEVGRKADVPVIEVRACVRTRESTDAGSRTA